MSSQTIANIFRAKNNAGESFAIGNDDDTQADAAVSAGYTIVTETSPSTDDGYVVAQRGGQYIIVANAGGPCAVKTTAEELAS